MTAERLLIAFIAVSITGGMAGGILQLLMPLYASSLAVTAAGVGAIRGVAQFGGLLTSLPGGFLIDRFGARWVYGVTSLLDAFVIAAVPRCITPLSLTSILFLEGALGTLRWTTINSAFFSRLESFGHGRAGWTRASLAIGANFIGPLAGGILTSYTGFSTGYIAVAIMVAFPALLLPVVGRSLSGATCHVSIETAPFKEQVRKLLGNVGLWRIALLQSTGISSNSAYLVYVIILTVSAFGYSPVVASYLIAVQGIAFVASMFWGGRFVGNFSFRTLYSYAYGLQIFGLVGTGSATSRLLLLISGAAFGLGSGLLTTISFSRLGTLPGAKGKLSGLFFLITGCGVALGPLYGGLLVQNFGIRAAFTGFVPVIALAAMVAAIPRR